jgi:hypothetical protein
MDRDAKANNLGIAFYLHNLTGENDGVGRTGIGDTGEGSRGLYEECWLVVFQPKRN